MLRTKSAGLTVVLVSLLSFDPCAVDGAQRESDTLLEAKVEIEKALDRILEKLQERPKPLRSDQWKDPSSAATELARAVDALEWNYKFLNIRVQSFRTAETTMASRLLAMKKESESLVKEAKESSDPPEVIQSLEDLVKLYDRVHKYYRGLDADVGKKFENVDQSYKRLKRLGRSSREWMELTAIDVVKLFGEKQGKKLHGKWMKTLREHAALFSEIRGYSDDLEKEVQRVLKELRSKDTKRKSKR